MGMLSGFIGGVAKGTADYIANQQKLDEEEERDKRRAAQQEERDVRQTKMQEELIAKRAEVADELKRQYQAMDEKRLSGQADKVDEVADASRLKRDASTLTSAAAGLPQEGEFAGQSVRPEDIKDMPEAARAIYEKSGMINTLTASQASKDKVDASRTVGADKTLMDSYKAQYTADQTAERAAAKEQLAREDAERKERQAKEDRKSSERNTDVRTAAAIQAAGISHAPKPDKPPKAGELNDIQKAELKSLDKAMDDARGPKAKAVAKQAYDDKLSEFGGGSTKKADQSPKDVGKSIPAIASVKGAPAGASIGAMVSGKGWEVKDSKGKVIGYAKD